VVSFIDGLGKWGISLNDRRKKVTTNHSEENTWKNRQKGGGGSYYGKLGAKIGSYLKKDETKNHESDLI